MVLTHSLHLLQLLDRRVMMQVYVSVYADGPTRVLRFADEKSTALLEAEQSILDLAARLKQVCGFTAHYCLQLPFCRSLHVDSVYHAYGYASPNRATDCVFSCKHHGQDQIAATCDIMPVVLRALRHA